MHSRNPSSRTPHPPPHPQLSSLTRVSSSREDGRDLNLIARLAVFLPEWAAGQEAPLGVTLTEASPALLISHFHVALNLKAWGVCVGGWVCVWGGSISAYIELVRKSSLLEL